MFGFFEKMFIGLLRFSRSLAAKCMSLNDELCKTIPALNSVKLIDIHL